jgi:Ca-activated chloride channel family protein
MRFLAPASFALAALIPVIIAMYLLKLRRTEQVVSSVYLWQRMVRDVEANAPWQKLRRNLLLIVQLLFLATLILALARPFTWAEGVGGQAAILILDTSASMAATDVAPSRLGAAKAQAQQLVEGLPDDVRLTIIAAGDGAQVLVSSSQDRRQARLVLDGIQAGAGGSDLTAALELASAIAARQPDTEIVVFSDGRVTLPGRLALKGHVRYVPMGVSGENQAIGILSLQAAPGGSGLTAFVQVVNYGEAAAQRRLVLYADDQLVNVYDLEIPPGEQRAVVADDLPPDSRIVEAQLADQDALSLDDRAWAVYRGAEPAAVTLVTEGNLFLETALSLLPGLEVTTVKPEDMDQGWQEGEGASETPLPTSRLTIFDAYVPITATLPSGNLLFIAPPRSTDVFSVTGRVEQPVLRTATALGGGQEATDPLLAHVNPAEVNVLEAVRIPLPAWARPVIVGDAAGESTPLLFAGETGGRRIAVLAFDLHQSDLPLQVAFPLLLANLAGWLAPGGGGDLPTQVTPGAPVTLALPPDVEAVRVTRPNGSTARIGAEGGQALLADTAQLGVYRAEWGQEQQVYFAVDLFSPQESDVRPADSLPLAGSAGGAGEREGAAAQQARHEWWRALAFAALAALVAEWLIYQRATLARLWAGARSLLRRGERHEA